MPLTFPPLRNVLGISFHRDGFFYFTITGDFPGFLQHSSSHLFLINLPQVLPLPLEWWAKENLSPKKVKPYLASGAICPVSLNTQATEKTAVATPNSSDRAHPWPSSKSILHPLTKWEFTFLDLASLPLLRHIFVNDFQQFSMAGFANAQFGLPLFPQASLHIQSEAVQ